MWPVGRCCRAACSLQGRVAGGEWCLSEGGHQMGNFGRLDESKCEVKIRRWLSSFSGRGDVPADSQKQSIQYGDVLSIGGRASIRQAFLPEHDRIWAIVQQGIRQNHNASSATELAGIAVSMYEKEKEKSERGPLAAYESLLDNGTLRQDPRQQSTVNELERVYVDLVALYRGLEKSQTSGLTLLEAHGKEARTGWWKSLFSSDGDDEKTAKAVVKGLYMYGGVGCGKTMLMDMFAESVPSSLKMERIHFHDFMLEVHELLQEHREVQDPLAAVAKDFVSKSKLLCLDELFVNDIADATILHRLFDQLWANGVTLVATSNRHPDNLYEGGLQRQLFLPFIDSLKEKCVIHNMDSVIDYRKLAHHATGLYFTSENREQELQDRFLELTNKNHIHPETVQVEMGRQLTLSKVGGCIAFASFNELCDMPLGAADYMAIAKSKHSLALSSIPKFDSASKTAAYRFVTLIDILYENKIRLLCSAEASPDDLFSNVETYVGSKAKNDKENNSDMIVDDNLGFVKDRTVSRLIEMQSNEYLIAHAVTHAPELLLALKEERSRKRFAKR